MDDAKFGTPPRTIEEWLRIFIKDCDTARRDSLNPFTRLRLRAHVEGLESALLLFSQQRNKSLLPATLQPSESIALFVPLSPR